MTSTFNLSSMSFSRLDHMPNAPVLADPTEPPMVDISHLPDLQIYKASLELMRKCVEKLDEVEIQRIEADRIRQTAAELTLERTEIRQDIDLIIQQLRVDMIRLANSPSSSSEDSSTDEETLSETDSDEADSSDEETQSDEEESEAEEAENAAEPNLDRIKLAPGCFFRFKAQRNQQRVANGEKKLGKGKLSAEWAKLSREDKAKF